MVDVDSTIPTDAVVAARWKPLILALMIVALLLRLAAAILVERHVQNAGRPFLIEGDANGYWHLAQNIAAGQDYAIYTPPRHVLRMPGFPMLLAASIRLFGDNVLAARIVLAGVGTACCWLTYCLGRRLHMRRTGFWAALFVAVHPLHVGNSVLILSETWFTFWMLLSLISLLWWLDPSSEAPTSGQAPALPNSDDTLRSIPDSCRAVCFCPKRLAFRATLSGLLIGLAVMVRPGFLPWLAVCCAAALTLFNVPRSAATSGSLRTRVAADWRRKLPACAGLMIGCLAVMLPWAIRNKEVTGHWVFTSLWSGPSLYDGLNPTSTGASDMRFFDEENVLDRMSEFEMNDYYKSRAIRFAMQNPGTVAVLALKKAALFLSPVPNYVKSEGWGVSAVCAGLWFLLVSMSVAGYLSKQWDAVGLLVMVGPLVLFLLVHMVFVGSVRYRLPLEFPLAVLAAIGWRRLALGGSRGISRK